MRADKNLLSDLKARGLLYQSTDESELANHLAAPRTLYCGFDPTADSLHIGSLVPLLTLRRFQLAGHQPIALVGGATGMIGDPSFKDQERQLNDDDVVKGWTEKLRAQASRFIDVEDPDTGAKVVNNLDWIGGMTVISFLRDIGKHFSVNAMIRKEAVKNRLEREDVGISFTEFSYALLQGLDFAELYKSQNCTVQLGGSDQWGNITAGVDLTRRLHEAHVHALTMPLVTKADGSKFGKTESGTIWLDAAKTSPYAFYQFWLNTADADVEKFLKMFTFLTIPDIKALVAEHNQAPQERQAQKRLAENVTELVHGKEALEQAQHLTDIVFSSAADKWQRLSETDFHQLRQDGLPATKLAERAVPILTAMSTAGVAQSNRQAREFIDAGAVRVNEQPIPPKDYNHTLQPESALFEKFTVLQVGRKKTHLLYWE